MLNATDLVRYRPIPTGHEGKFNAFLLSLGRSDLATATVDETAFVIQVSFMSGDDAVAQRIAARRAGR